MSYGVFSEDFITSKPHKVYGRARVSEFAAKIEADTRLNCEEKAVSFSREINENILSNFEKDEDKMCHVSTFVCMNGKIYMSYYANTQTSAEDPNYQVARLAYCSKDDMENKTIIDIQAVGDTVDGRRINLVYDTIIMYKDSEPENLYILWTARVDDNYYRFYRVFNMITENLGEVMVNRFKVKNITNDFSAVGIKNALAENDIGYKEFFSDIGIMQKLSWRIENGEKYYYTGAYSGNFTCIIKSKDLITWEYVAQPDEGEGGFENETLWENAVYVSDDKVYYFVRQWNAEYNDDKTLKSGSEYGILTYYDLNCNRWEKPVLVGDCQSRSDFIEYDGKLYLFYAPTDREHIGLLRIDTERLDKTQVVFQSDIKGSCFYPFVQYFDDGALAMSYTVGRKHIRLSKFDMKKYV